MSPDAAETPAASGRSRTSHVLPGLAWGIVLAAWLVRGFFLLPPGQIHANHEGHTYVYRAIEFRELLAAGYLSPQWCVDFRGGLGAPYFSYYQPGFFYVASLALGFLSPVRALGAAAFLFALVGYAGTHALVRQVFGAPGALLAASALLLSVYCGTELYIRGDLSEFGALMLLPVLMWALWNWHDRGHRRHLAYVALAGAAVIVTHPCVAVPAFGLLLPGLLGWAVLARDRRAPAAIGALTCGGLLAAFYWMPLVREWRLVNGERAFEGFYDYANHFIDPRQLLERYHHRDLVPLTLGPVLPVTVLVNTVGLAFLWRRLAPGQRRLSLALAAMMAASVFLMTPLSKPIWDAALPLQRLQFPWRFESLLTVATAAYCGALLPSLDGRMRWILAVTAVAALAWLSPSYTRAYAPQPFPEPRSAADIAEIAYFEPDRMDEWTPRGAAIEFPAGVPKRPRATAGAGVGGLRREPGRLACRVTTSAAARISLPHYYFPVGWRAELDGKAVPLAPDADGLMQVELPAGVAGELEVRFHMTPARRLGWIVSLSTLVAAALVAAVSRRPPSKAGPRARASSAS